MKQSFPTTVNGALLTYTYQFAHFPILSSAGVTPVSPTLPTLLPHHRRDPRFPGIIFYGDPILKMVGSDGCKLAWPEIGICLHFPPNAVPDGKALHLTIWPCLSGPFVPPEGREFSSPVYLISPAFHFQEDVELSINHFENLRCQEDVASMSFATTLSSKEIHTSKPVYTFESLGKGDFKVTSSVGTINLRHFCRNEFCQVAATRKRQRCSQDDEPEAERTTKRSKGKLCCSRIATEVFHITISVLQKSTPTVCSFTRAPLLNTLLMQYLQSACIRNSIFQ